jgi:hypothetical protein
MTRNLFTRRATLFTLLASLLITPSNFYAEPSLPLQQQPPNISVNGFYSMDKAKQGRALQAAVVMEIPQGYHVNSNRPLSKYAEATTLKIEAPGGLRVSPVSYPRAVTKKFGFSKDPLAVYEGETAITLPLAAAAGAKKGAQTLKGKLRVQACDDEKCYPPRTLEASLPVTVK